jgi:hypothetical protein
MARATLSVMGPAPMIGPPNESEDHERTRVILSRPGGTPLRASGDPLDGAFDRVAALAARIFDVPIATVTIGDEAASRSKLSAACPKG